MLEPPSLEFPAQDPSKTSALRRSGWRSPIPVILTVILIAGAALLGHFPALSNSPTLDDAAQFEVWPVPRTPAQWAQAAVQPWWPPRYTKREWRPLARLSIQAQAAIQQRMNPAAVRPYYAFNLILHAIVCVLLYCCAVRWRISPIAALAGALIFAVHPLLLEAIHQIVGRTEMMSAGWMLLGFILWTRWGPWSSHAFWQQPLICALALASKETAVLYPFYLALASLAAPVGQLPATEGRRRWSETGQATRLALLLASLALTTAVWLGAKAFVAGGLFNDTRRTIPSENLLAFMSFAERIPATLGSLGYAAAKLSWPAAISPDYSAVSLPYALGWRWPYAWAGSALAAALSVYAALNFRRGGKGWALAIGGLVAWLLTSGLVLTIGVSMAPRLLYFPMLPACLGAGWLLSLAFKSIPENLLPAARRKTAGTLGLALIAAGLMAVSWRDSRAWRSLDDYTAATLKIFPYNYRAHIHLSLSSYNAGNYAAGAVAAKRATQIFPDAASGWEWIGLNEKHIAGMQADAEAAYRKAIELNSIQPEYWKNLGNLLLEEGKARDAAAAYGEYLKFDDIPDRMQAELALARLNADATGAPAAR